MLEKEDENWPQYLVHNGRGDIQMGDGSDEVVSATRNREGGTLTFEE